MFIPLFQVYNLSAPKYGQYPHSGLHASPDTAGSALSEGVFLLPHVENRRGQCYNFSPQAPQPCTFSPCQSRQW